MGAQEFKIGKDVILRTQLTEDEFMLMPVVLYGFSLGDRKWRMSHLTLIGGFH